MHNLFMIILKLKQLKHTLILLFVAIFFSCQGNDYYNMGVYSAKHDNHKDAIKYFTKAIEKDANYVDALFNRAMSKQFINDDKGAIIDYSFVIKMDSKDSEAYMNRGVSKMKLGKRAEAILDYEMAIKLNPKYTLSYYNLGNAHSLFEIEKACENWKKAAILGHEKSKILIKEYCN